MRQTLWTQISHRKFPLWIPFHYILVTYVRLHVCILFWINWWVKTSREKGFVQLRKRTLHDYVVQTRYSYGKPVQTSSQSVSSFSLLYAFHYFPENCNFMEFIRLDTLNTARENDVPVLYFVREFKIFFNIKCQANALKFSYHVKTILSCFIAPLYFPTQFYAFSYVTILVQGKGIPLQAWEGSRGSRRLRFLYNRLHTWPGRRCKVKRIEHNS
jgi:hypothetical protein